MSVIVLLIAAGAVVAGGFLASFFWAVRAGQFDDLRTPAVRILVEDAGRQPSSSPSSSSSSAEGAADVH